MSNIVEYIEQKSEESQRLVGLKGIVNLTGTAQN